MIRELAVLAGLLGSARALVAITPIGPFCPFKSTACADGSALGSTMGDLTQDVMPKFASEMARIELQLQMGQTPDPDRVRSLADELTAAEGRWGAMLSRMQLLEDFQAREYYKLTVAFAKRNGESMESIGLGMRWQADCMRSMANGQMPPMPPPGLDLAKLEQQAQAQGRGGGMSMLAQVNAAQSVDAQPLTGDEPAFESDVVRDEFKALCSSHASIIKLGESYGTFDPMGKVAFLDALEAVESRWDTFFKRFELLGQLNPEFGRQTDAVLESMGMSADDFRAVLSEAHELMREDAEAERRAMA